MLFAFLSAVCEIIPTCLEQKSSRLQEWRVTEAASASNLVNTLRWLHTHYQDGEVNIWHQRKQQREDVQMWRNYRRGEFGKLVFTTINFHNNNNNSRFRSCNVNSTVSFQCVYIVSVSALTAARFPTIEITKRTWSGRMEQLALFSSFLSSGTLVSSEMRAKLFYKHLKSYF